MRSIPRSDYLRGTRWEQLSGAPPGLGMARHVGSGFRDETGTAGVIQIGAAVWPQR